jgi:hypothetical protein
MAAPKKLATIKDLIQNKELFDAEQQAILTVLQNQTDAEGGVAIFKTDDGELDRDFVLDNDEELSSEYLDGIVEQRANEYGDEEEDEEEDEKEDEGAHIIEELKQMRQQMPSLWADKRLHLNRALRESVIPDDVIKAEIKPYLAGSRRKRKSNKRTTRKRKSKKRTTRKRKCRKRTTRKRK